LPHLTEWPAFDLVGLDGVGVNDRLELGPFFVAFGAAGQRIGFALRRVSVLVAFNFRICPDLLVPPRKAGSGPNRRAINVTGPTDYGPMIAGYGGSCLATGGCHETAEGGHWRPERVVIYWVLIEGAWC
jgi:hypothetical protein